MAIFPFHAPEHASPAAAFEQPYLGRGYTAPRSTGNSTATYEEAWTAAEKAVASGVTAATAMEAKINALNGAQSALENVRRPSHTRVVDSAVAAGGAGDHCHHAARA